MVMVLNPWDAISQHLTFNVFHFSGFYLSFGIFLEMYLVIYPQAERDVGSSADEAEPQYKLDALLLTLSRADEQQHVSDTPLRRVGCLGKKLFVRCSFTSRENESVALFTFA